MKIDKQLLELYQDFDYEELLWLVEHPEEIETGENYQTDGVIAEHLKIIKEAIKILEKKKTLDN